MAAASAASRYSGYTPFFFCDLEFRKSHQITVCLTYFNTVSITWDKKVHLLTKKMRIAVKISSSESSRSMHLENSDWTIDRHCGIFLLSPLLPSCRITAPYIIKLWLINNYSPKARWILSNNPRDEVEGIIRQYSLSLRRIIVLV